MILKNVQTCSKSIWYELSKMSKLGVRNHVKLEICSFVINFQEWGFSLRILYCMVGNGYGLGGSLGVCRPALPKGWKYQMVKTQTESHDRRPIVWTNW